MHAGMHISTACMYSYKVCTAYINLVLRIANSQKWVYINLRYNEVCMRYLIKTNKYIYALYIRTNKL